MLLIFAAYKQTLDVLWTKLPLLSMGDMTLLILTCIFGTTIGLSYFFLLKLVSATSIVSANIGYKLITFFISILIWSVPFYFYGWIGLLVSFFGLCWYTYIKNTEPVNRRNINLPVIFGFFISFIAYFYFYLSF
jgi:hypothetical protein